MANDPTEPVDPAPIPTPDPDDEAPASRVGPLDDTEPLPGTAAMDADTGGLAGTSR